MRVFVLTFIVTLLLGSSLQAEEKQPLKTEKDRISYAIGVDQVRNFKRQGMEIDLEKVVMGMQAAGSGGKLLLSDGEMSKILADYARDLKFKQEKIKQEAAVKNKKEGDAYRKENKAKQGVVTTASGLQYKVIKDGTGKKPVEDSRVTVRYRGTLLDGTLFDSSDRIGYPLTFPVKESVLAGWKETLLLMPAGSVWQVVFPPELAFGENGAGRDVGPNATVLYEIELLTVDPQQAPVPDKKKDAIK